MHLKDTSFPFRSSLSQLSSPTPAVTAGVTTEDVAAEGQTRGVLPKSPRMMDLEDRFEIIGTLGRGTQGSVAEAFDKLQNRMVALKVTPKRFLNLAINEISILTRLSELQVVPKIIDVLCKGKKTYLAMEKLPGQSLLSQIEALEDDLTESEAKERFHQILSVVLSLHILDIAHLDLKLENIIINDDDPKLPVRLVDFGFSRVTRGKLVDKFSGSVHYACPEILKQKSFDGKKADVWSLGVILFLLLHSAFPFDRKSGSSKDIFDCILTGVYSPKRDLSPDCLDFLSRLLAVAPETRWEISQLLKHPWLSRSN